MWSNMQGPESAVTMLFCTWTTGLSESIQSLRLQAISRHVFKLVCTAVHSPFLFIVFQCILSIEWQPISASVHDRVPCQDVCCLIIQRDSLNWCNHEPVVLRTGPYSPCSSPKQLQRTCADRYYVKKRSTCLFAVHTGPCCRQSS